MSETVKIIYKVIDDATSKLGRIAKGIKSVGTTSKTTSAAVTGLGTAASVASGMIFAYLAVEGVRAVQRFASESIQAFADFEYAMADVAAKLGTSLGDITELADTAKRLGMEYGIGAKEAAQGLVAFAAAGFDAAESNVALETAMHMSIISGIGMEQSAVMLVRALSVFGAGADEAAKYVDALVAADLASTAAASDLAIALGYAGSNAKSMGLDVYDSMTAIAALSDRVGGATKAGRYFAALLRDLRMKSKDLGIEIYTAEGSLRNFGDIVAAVSLQMEGLTTTQKNAWLISIGFTGQSINAMLALADMGDTAEETAAMWDELYDEIRKTGGAAAAVETKMDTLQKSMDKFKVAVELLQISLMEGLHPSLEKTIGDLTNFMSAITKVSDQTNKLNKYIKENPMPDWLWKRSEYIQWHKDLEAFQKGLYTIGEVADEVGNEISDAGKEIGEGLMDPLESAIDEINRLIRDGLLGDAQGKFHDFTDCVTDKAGQMALGVQDEIYDLMVSTEEGYARLRAMAEKMPEGPGRRAAIQRVETYRTTGYERIEALESMLSTLLTTGTIPTAAMDPSMSTQGGDVTIGMEINMYGIDPDSIDFAELRREMSEELLRQLIDAGVVGG